MKTVIILAESVTESSLAAVVPADGIASVRVTQNPTNSRSAFAAESYRSYRNPLRFNPAVRVEMIVDDNAAGTVFDAVSWAYRAGFFSDAEMWIESPALALSA